MKFITISLAVVLFNSCENAKMRVAPVTAQIATEPKAKKSRHFEGTISNGYKGDKISFDVSADGKKLENLTFSGYWKCASGLDQTTVGPDGAFEVVNNKVSGHITEPPNGGSTAWRFELEAIINGKQSEGTFRMNINNLGCDTYKLKWTAVVK